MKHVSRNRASRLAGALGLAVVLLAAPAFAQPVTATLTGTVTDATDKSPLKGATIIVTSPNLQGSRSMRTDAEGFYRLPQLPPGTYRVSFVKGGHKTLTYAEVVLGANMTVRLNAELPRRAEAPAGAPPPQGDAAPPGGDAPPK